MENENLFVSVIRIWAAAAWADGEMVKNERAALEKFIARADLSEADRVKAMGFLDRKVELDSATVDHISVGEREGIYRAACKLATVDNHVADDERSFLKRLASLLELDTELSETIERSAGVLPR